MKTGEPSPRLRVADVGTGSGCLAVVLARELPHADIVATDISSAALEVARLNAARHGVSDRIHFVEADLLNEVHGSPQSTSQALPAFDLIVSNPPYIGQNEASSLQREVREHEPDTALFGGPTGIEIYQRLIAQAESLLAPHGILVLELGYNSAEAVRKLLRTQQRWANVSVTNDLAGIPRVIAAELV